MYLNWLFIASFAFIQFSSADISNITNSCYEYLESHFCEGEKWGMKYHFYKPANEKYSADQWLWDSGAHMIVWSHRNVTNSILDLRTMLQQQQPNGRIPEEIFWSDRDSKQNAAILLEYSNDVATDITQMPVLPFSLRAIYEKTNSKELLKEFLYPLVRYFDWWRSERDISKDGLVVIIHNWESGLDASPAYDPAFHTYVTTLNQSAWLHIYPKFWELVESYKLLFGWNVPEILAREEANPNLDHLDTWFVVKDAAVNSVYAAGWKLLGEFASELGDNELADRCQKEYSLTRDAIIKKMWIPDRNRFSTLYIDNDGVEKISISNTVQNLFPLLLNDLPQTYVDVLVQEIEDPEVFNAPKGVPTVAMNDPQFSADFPVDLMWRGPIWGFTTWFVMEGLGYHGKTDTQSRILDKWINLVEEHGIFEHYNPYTGEGYGPEGLGMSTLICDWIYRYGYA